MLAGSARDSGCRATGTRTRGRAGGVTLLEPRHPPPPIRVPLAASSAMVGRKLPSVRVLLVEDDAVIRELLVQLFVDQGWRYRDAVDAEAALEALREGEGFDLLITDVGLPGLNGRLLANAARTLGPLLPVLCITRYAAGSEPPVPLVGERMAVLAKPFTLDAFVARVQDILSTTERLGFEG